MDTPATTNDRELGICYSLIALQALLYIVALRIYLGTTGTWSDVGSNFIAFWILAIVPGSLALAWLLKLAYRSWRRAARPKIAFFAGALLLDAIILLLSFNFYASYLHR